MINPKNPVLWQLSILSVLMAGCLDVDSAEYQEISVSPGAPASVEVSVAAAEAAASDSETIDDSASAAVESPSTKPDPVSEQPLETDSANATVKTESTTGTSVQEAGSTAEEPVDATGQNVAEATDAASDSTPNPPVKVEQRKIKLLVPERKFRVEGPEQSLRISYDDVDLLKILNMDPVPEGAPKHFPDWLKNLDGKRIRLRGFMMPSFSETDIQGFTLARDTQLCCFGRSPKPYDLIDVFMRKGVTTYYPLLNPFDVVGVFHIGTEVKPGYLFTIDDAIVIHK